MKKDLEEKYKDWYESFKKRYTTIKPTMLDAFKGAYHMAIMECLDMPNFKLSKEEVDNILSEVDNIIENAIK